MTAPHILLKNYQMHARKELGQNFLRDPATARMIVARAGIGPEDVVLEIGAGLGALTIPAAQAAKKVYAVEKDPRVFELLKSELALHGISNAVAMQEDILKVAIDDLAAREGCRILVMGNLPYNISSQVLVRMVAIRSSVRRAVLMFQKELSMRLRAGPGSRDYGRLSVMLRYCADIKAIAQVGAGLFFPRPKVDSEVVEIRFKDPVDHPAGDEEFLFRVVKAAFGKRRKTLKNALVGSDFRMDSETAIRALEEAGIEPFRRAETLSVEEFVKLSDGLLNLGI